MTYKRLIGLGFAVSLLSFGGSAFVEDASATHPVELICPAPISVCMPTITGEPDSNPAIVPSPSPCPDGYSCACVPSCPECDDCAAQVCVRDPSPVHDECRTACDCETGLGCFDGRCIAGFAPVFCCERDGCTEFGVCQSESGEFKRCGDDDCESPQMWLCPDSSSDRSTMVDGCGEGRECSCSASCQFCEDCGPGVCVPEGAPTPYRCESDADCADGDSCRCVSSCPDCDDCAMSVCAPERCDDRQCELRARKAHYKIKRVVRRASRCETDDHCVHVSTDTDCQGSCGAFVNRMYAEPVTRIIDRIDKRICDGYQEAGCPYATPGCIQQTGVCRRGRCRGVAADF